MKERRCTGACCRQFTLPVDDVEELGRRTDINEAGLLRVLFYDGDEPGLFRCWAWDDVNRTCTIYEDRPKLCRDYPYGRRCAHCGAKTHAAAVAERPAWAQRLLRTTRRLRRT